MTGSLSCTAEIGTTLSYTLIFFKSGEGFQQRPHELLKGSLMRCAKRKIYTSGSSSGYSPRGKVPTYLGVFPPEEPKEAVARCMLAMLMEGKDGGKLIHDGCWASHTLSRSSEMRCVVAQNAG